MQGEKDLLEKVRQQEAQLALISSVQEGLLSKKDISDIYVELGEKIKDLFDTQVAVICTFDHNIHQEVFHYVYEEGERHYPSPRHIDKLRQKLIEEGEIIYISEDADAVWTQITGEEPTVVPGTKATKSALYVPMIAGNTVFGYISIQNVDRENAFEEEDIRLLNTIASSIGVTLENARLFNETEERNAELAVINSVQQGLVAETDMQDIYDLVGDKIRNLFEAQVAAIATFDLSNKLEIFNYLYEDGKRYYPNSQRYNKLRQWIIENKQPLHIKENIDRRIEEITGEEHIPVEGTRRARSLVFVPLTVGDRVTGYVSLQNLDKENAFSDANVRLLTTLANSMSVALENARLFNETTQRNAELDVINSVQEGLMAKMDLQKIYELVGNKTRDLFDAQVVSIATFDPEKQQEIFNYNFENGKRIYPKPRTLDRFRELLIREKETIHLKENVRDFLKKLMGKDPEALPGTVLPKTMVFVPMVINGEVKGYVSLQNLDHENAFSDSDIRLLNTLVNSMSVALENARLFNETTRLLDETEKRNSELQIINSVQEGLVKELDMRSIYKEVGDRICEVLHTQTLIIRTFDLQEKIENWEYAVEGGEEMTSEPRPIIWANKILIENKEPLLINQDYQETARKHGSRGFTEGLVPKSAIFIPMVVGDVIKGSVSLQNIEKEFAFNEDDVRLLTTLTNSMSFAIENARLFNETTRLLEETERRAAELHTVNNISKAIVSQLELDALIGLVGEHMRSTFSADIVYLALHDRPSNMLNFPYYYGDKSQSRKFGNGITEKIIMNKEPLLVNTNLDETYEKIKAEKRGQMVSSYLGVPIMAGEEAIGVISVQSKDKGNKFSVHDEHLLTTIAANVGIAIQNAETYQKMKAALGELKAAQNQLVQQEKLASLGQLTAGIAHEIKNPLNFVNNFSDVSIELIEEAKTELTIIRSNETSDSTTSGKANLSLENIEELLTDIERNLKKIHEHGTRADTIVKSMLQHSRGGTGKMQPTDLNLLVREYVNLAFHGMRAGKHPVNVDIKLDLDENLGLIPVIREDFSRVILNLCNNAFDAVREKLQSTSFIPELEVRTHRKDNMVELVVHDNGPGIPDDIKDKILQPFFTTKKGTEGTGLGLSITNDIMKAHGGEMDIETSPESGTKFILHLSADNLVQTSV